MIGGSSRASYKVPQKFIKLVNTFVCCEEVPITAANFEVLIYKMIKFFSSTLSLVSQYNALWFPYLSYALQMPSQRSLKLEFTSS